MNITRYLADREEDSFIRHCQFSRILTGEARHIFDVGGNVGQSISRYKECFPDCLLTSFEPNPESFSQMKKTWENVPGITLNPVALSDFVGQAPFFVTRVSAGSSLLKPTDRIVQLSAERKYDHTAIRVPTTTLDSYCQLNNVENVDILKLDVQGFELRVLRGAKKMLRLKKITLIYSEVIFADTYENQTRFLDLVSYLSEFDYEIWDIGSFLYTRNNRLWAANVTFLHVGAADRLETSSMKRKDC